MCHFKGVRLFVMLFSFLKFAFMLYIFAAGIYMVQTKDVLRAFGLQFIQYGLSLIFLALLSTSMILPFRYAINRHNRFILAVVFVFETIVFCNLISTGYTIMTYTYPVFSKSMQLDCLLNNPTQYTDEECKTFFTSDRTVGFRLYWDYYFTNRNNKVSYQVLSNIQGGFCCGFYQPFKCIENKASFPANRDPSGVSSELLQQVVTCSNFPKYYPKQTDCIDYIDFAANPPIIGGCFYDLGVGQCLKADVLESSMGCASRAEDFAIALISAHAPLIMGTSGVNFVYMLIACCFWWKRRESDIFPESETQKAARVSFVIHHHRINLF